MTHPENRTDFVSVREFDQLSIRVSENVLRVAKLEDERPVAAVVSSQLAEIRTDFASHEQRHVAQSDALRADLRTALLKVGVAVLLAILGEIAQLLHTYLH